MASTQQSCWLLPAKHSQIADMQSLCQEDSAFGSFPRILRAPSGWECGAETEVRSYPVGVEWVQGEVQGVWGALSLAQQGVNAAALQQGVPTVASQAYCVQQQPRQLALVRQQVKQAQVCTAREYSSLPAPLRQSVVHHAPYL